MVRVNVRNRAAAVLLALWLAAVVGCSSIPTQPLVTGPGSADPGKTSHGPPPGVALPGPPDGGSPPSLPPLESEPIDGDVVESGSVNGATGALMNAGPFSLEVPGGAYFGTAVITMVAKHGSELRVSLHISGVDNHFYTPVILSADVSRFPDPRRLAVLWFDEARDEWVEIPSAVDPETGRIQAPLDHFSDYAVREVFRSKAGW